MRVVLTLELDVAMKEYEDHWAATNESLGLVVHADTSEQVQSRFTTAVGALLDAFGQDTNKLRAYLDRQGVRHFVRQMPTSAPAPKRHFSMTSQVEVPLGAVS